MNFLYLIPLLFGFGAATSIQTVLRTEEFNNLEKFHYNGIVANLYEAYNFMIKVINQPLDHKDLLINYKKILRVPIFSL